MNLLLFEQHELNAGCLLLTDNRAKHIRTVLKLNVGDALRIGMVNGKMGRGKIISMDDNTVELEVQLNCAPSPPPDGGADSPPCPPDYAPTNPEAGNGYGGTPLSSDQISQGGKIFFFKPRCWSRRKSRNFFWRD